MGECGEEVGDHECHGAGFAHGAGVLLLAMVCSRTKRVYETGKCFEIIVNE